MSEMKFYELHLPYYKQGDDLQHFLQLSIEADSNTAADDGSASPGIDQGAFIAHAQMLDETALILRRCAQLAADGVLEIADAGTHFIGVYIDESIAPKLLEEGLICESLFDDEDFEETGEDEEEDDDEYGETVEA